MAKKMTFIAAIKDFFGPATGDVRFIDEMRGLSQEDKDEFRDLLADEGYDITT